MENQKKIWIQISSGSGPSECERACFLVYEALKKFSNKNKCIIYELDKTMGYEKNTIKSVFLSLENVGFEVLKILKSSEGTIKWIANSPFRKKHKRKNWFIKFELFELENKSYNIDPKDIEIKATKASGAGGQHVNKTNSAIQITHLPTNIHFKVKEERSFIMNKKLALARLEKLLSERKAQSDKNQRQELWISHQNLERGNPNKVFKGNNFKFI